MKTNKCPYKVQREVNRFEWSMPDMVKVVSFRLNIEDGVNGDIVVKVLCGEFEGLFVHYKLTASPHDKNEVQVEADEAGNGEIKTYGTMREAMKPYGLKRGYNPIN